MSCRADKSRVHIFIGVFMGMETFVELHAKLDMYVYPSGEHFC